MLHDSQLYIIDFQDARMGPDTYDLVSLLRDSYVDLPEPTVERADRVFPGAQGAERRRQRAFRRRFDLMALQRNLKALGTFGYQTTARRNPVYIQYIPRTLRYVRNNLENLPDSAACGSCSRPTSRSSGSARKPGWRPRQPWYNEWLTARGKALPSVCASGSRRISSTTQRLSGAPGADCGARVRGDRAVRHAQPLRLPRRGGDCGARRAGWPTPG